MKRAAEFKRSVERPRVKSTKPSKPKAPSADTTQAGVSASATRKGMGHSAPRNRAATTAKKAAFALEDSATGRPSRKSSRSGANRQKPDSNLHRRQTRRTTSPKARAARAK